MMNCSYGNALRLCGNEKYRQVIINTAESLCTRFNPKTGSIKSWNYRKAWDGKTEWYYPVIIDNMMNLELLFLATELSGNNKYKEVAITHALTTMKNHYRDDYSCCHVVDYDAETGAVLDKATCQGFTDESSWARGQAWGLYGFVMCYRETGDQRFLDFAKNIAGYIMNSPLIPADKIPYWDYHVNQPGHTPEWNYQAEKYDIIPRDVSAVTITASALFDLSTMLEDGQKYYAYADAILKSVLSPSYCTRGDDTAYFYLKQSVGSVPHGGEISQPVNYADYYYFEALLRKQNIDNSHD
jgi:chondroitin AC lyase